METKKLAFITVTYLGDIPLWRLQARSIAKFASSTLVESIVVIVNDLDEEARMKTLSLVRDNVHLYGKHADRVRVISIDDILRRSMHHKGGWIKQQVAKLRCYELVECEDLVLLDSKNHLVSTVKHHTFFNSQGKPKTYFQPRTSQQFQYEWLLSSLRAVGLSEEWATRPSPPTVTPYVVTRSALRDICNFLDERHGSIEDLFLTATDKPTEFFLIYAVILKKYADATEYFSNGLSRPNTIFKQWPQSDEAFEIIFSKIESGKHPFFAIHGGRKDRLTKDQISRISNIWSTLDLADVDESVAILGHPTD